MKIYSYFAILVFTLLALIPSVDIVIKNPPSHYWPWMIVIAGFLGVFTLFIKTSWPVRVIAIVGFIHCFFSAIPYVSFTSYVSLVGCCYFYIICSKIEDWSIVFKAIQAIVLLNILFMVMQHFHKDGVLNFGHHDIEQYGTIGYHMWMASFGTILGAVLLPFSIFNLFFSFGVALFVHSTWTFLCASFGTAVYFSHRNKNKAGVLLLILCVLFIGWAIADHKIMENMNTESGRMGIWEQSIRLANQHPWKGWGIGTYKDLFFGLSGLHCMEWKTAHNFLIQLCFEIGYPLTACVAFGLGWLAWVMYKAELWAELAGLTMVILDAMVHTPDRFINMVPLMVVFLAYTRWSLWQTRSLHS
jgi:hypothetical protein